MPPLAVTFDFWDTLVQAPSASATRWARRDRLIVLLRSAGSDVSADGLDGVLAEVRRQFDEHWAANRQFTGTNATALMLELLEVSVDAGWRSRIADAFMGIDADDLPALTTNIEPVLRALQAHGVRLGIICDVGLSPSSVLRSYLDRHGVLDAFDHWSFSDEVGVYKPHPAIFDHALRGLGGVAPARAAHVGDLRRTDVAGAHGFGMTAVRYAGSNDDLFDPDDPAAASDDAVHVIRDHDELLAVLGF